MSFQPDVAKAADSEPANVQTTYVRGKSGDYGRHASAEETGGSSHGVPEMMDSSESTPPVSKKKEWFGYFKTKQFWILLVAGQCAALMLTGTNTFSSLLSGAEVSIPAFQSLFNYVLMALVWTSICIYKYGLKGFGSMVWKRGWKYLILSFFDVEGNYFTVLGYRYTTILSMQLLNFWAIVVVIILSFFFLKVRYNIFQVIGILVAVGGMGVLFGSDAITNANNFPASDRVKGNLFALLGATCYGVANTGQEYLISGAPMYEVLSMMGIFGTIINGVQAAIFDRSAFQKMLEVYTPKIGGWIAGFDLLLFLFYSTVPLILRLGSAAFLNISLLTANFWGTAVGVQVFGLTIHWMYPIAFVLIIAGQIVYFTMEGRWGDSFKPWLGANQERGFAGIGTAKRRIENPEAVV